MTNPSKKQSLLDEHKNYIKKNNKAFLINIKITLRKTKN